MKNGEFVLEHVANVWQMDKKNFRYWNHRILLILEENDLLNYAKEVISEPKEEEAKTTYKKNMVKAKRILFDRGPLDPSCVRIKFS